MLFIYEPFWLSHKKDNAAEGLCRDFDSNLRTKNVVYDEFCVSCLVYTRCFHFKDWAGTWFSTDSQASPYISPHKQGFPRGFGEQGNIGKISKGTREHEPNYREEGNKT